MPRPRASPPRPGEEIEWTSTKETARFFKDFCGGYGVNLTSSIPGKPGFDFNTPRIFDVAFIGTFE
jgi:hypothetical protein